MRKIVLSFIFCLLLTTGAHAHFQLIYTPDINLEKAGDVQLKLLFWHPMDNGPVMNMAPPQEFYSVFKGQKTDLSGELKSIKFKDAQAFDASLKIKRNGDYSVIVKQEPYLEESEDIFIQQITKVVINKGTIPTDWNEPIGLKTEIVPLNKPYGAMVGSTFSGVVLSDGKPVAHTEVEIEYLSAEPDMVMNKPSSDMVYSLPGGTIIIMTDANGKFTFGIPKAGFWGFAAVGSGPDTEHLGKELSQDAVLWIKAHELRN